MDEVEKYQQRLQAIAEKRRLQEEQDRAKRQLEDEKIRMQQMKRKSLRDQWLMEGPPLSPDNAGPRSPLWGAQAQQVEANIDKLQSEIIEKTQKHKEEGSTSEQSHTDHHGNGESASAVTLPPPGTLENGEEKNTNPSHDTSVTNGTAQGEKSHNAPVQHSNDVSVSTGTETLLFLGYTEAEPGHGLCEDADDVSEVIRAERVMITEEGEEVIEELQDTQAEEEEEEEPEEEREEEEEEAGGEEKGDEGKKEELEEEHKKEPEEGGEEEREEEREDENSEDVPNHLEAGEVTAVEEGETNTAVDVLNEESTVNLHAHADEETSVKADDDVDTNPHSKSDLNTQFGTDADPAVETLPQSLPESPEDTVSLTLPASGLNPNGAQKSPELTSSSANTAAQFQEIPLGGATVEEEPLLAAKVEPLSDAANPSQGEGAKTKTCQCCTVM